MVAYICNASNKKSIKVKVQHMQNGTNLLVLSFSSNVAMNKGVWTSFSKDKQEPQKPGRYGCAGMLHLITTGEAVKGKGLTCYKWTAKQAWHW